MVISFSARRRVAAQREVSAALGRRFMESNERGETPRTANVQATPAVKAILQDG